MTPNSTPRPPPPNRCQDMVSQPDKCHRTQSNRGIIDSAGLEGCDVSGSWVDRAYSWFTYGKSSCKILPLDVQQCRCSNRMHFIRDIASFLSICASGRNYRQWSFSSLLAATDLPSWWLAEWAHLPMTAAVCFCQNLGHSNVILLRGKIMWNEYCQQNRFSWYWP